MTQKNLKKLNDVSKRQVSFSKTAIIFIVHQFKLDTRPNVKNVINTPGVIGLAWDPPENSKNTSYNHVLKYRILPEVNQEVIRLAPGVHEFVFPTGRNIGRQYEIELSTVTDKEEGRPVKYTLRSGEQSFLAITKKRKHIVTFQFLYLLNNKFLKKVYHFYHFSLRS